MSWRDWLAANHAQERELWVGFYKRGSGKPSITWPESVDEALCFGWIDGIRKRIDDDRYVIRFTPRKPTSTWSAINIRRVAELETNGRMRAAGRVAFRKRTPAQSGVYSYEQEEAKQLGTAHEAMLRANAKAWRFFRSQPPWYQRTASWWINSAKREDTRLKRLRVLITDSAQGRTIPPLTRTKR